MGNGLTKLLPPLNEDNEDNDGDHPLGKKAKKGKDKDNSNKHTEAPKGNKKGKEKDEVLVMDERLFYVIPSVFFLMFEMCLVLMLLPLL